MINIADVQKFRQNIYKKYNEIYLNNGFIETKPLSLIASKDITLEFINCTICKAKSNMQKEIQGKDYVLFQPSMRTKDFNYIMRTDKISRYTSTFTMMGGFKYTENLNYKFNYEKIIMNEASFLRTFFDHIILTIPSAYRHFLELSNVAKNNLKKQNIILKYSDIDDEKLKWKYGIADVTGYGTRWEISNNNQIINTGNTIVVEKGKNIIGIDFGGGVESLIQAYYNLPHCIFANLGMTQELADYCIKGSDYIKVADSIIALINISKSTKNLTVGSIRVQYIFDYYVRALASLSILCKIDFMLLEQLIRKSANRLNSKNDNSKFICQKFKVRISELELLLKHTKVIESLKKIIIDDVVNLERHSISYLHKLESIELLALNHRIKDAPNL